MRVEVVRSGLVEAVHEVAVAVTDPEGRVVASSGDVDRRFFARSSVKPFQAHVARSLGAALEGRVLAIACSSHAGRPDQLELVDAVLAAAGLSAGDLATPASLPSSPTALMGLAADTAPTPRFHNCSGKHAGLLAACRAAGWPTVGYADPGHPAQRAVEEAVVDAVGGRLGEPGIDGCGFPTHEVSAVGLGAAFARLAVDPGFGPERAAIVTHPELIGDVGRPDGVVAAGLGFPAKVGAEGCFGIAVPGLGLGIGMKAWDGAGRALGPATIAVLAHLGVDLGGSESELEVAVLGSGRRVGTVRAIPDLV